MFITSSVSCDESEMTRLLDSRNRYRASVPQIPCLMQHTVAYIYTHYTRTDHPHCWADTTLVTSVASSRFTPAYRYRNSFCSEESTPGYLALLLETLRASYCSSVIFSLSPLSSLSPNSLVFLNFLSINLIKGFQDGWWRIRFHREEEKN